MRSIRILSRVAASATLTLSLTAADSAQAEPLPLARRSLGEVGYGHKDPVPEQARYGAEGFVPTPERPVYFRQTFGDYPGATPPLEWWEGTPTTKKVKIGDSKSSREAEVVDFADQKSKNILWKVPVPGWSLSHPIVVGKKVFAVGEPDFVTCWDLDTGKQLWQRRIMPLLCDGLSEEKAAAGQKVLDLARAFFYIGTGGFLAGRQHNNLFGGFKKDGSLAQGQDPAAFMAEKRQMAERYLKALAPHRADVEVFGDAALLAALDKDLEIIKRCQAATDLDAFKREARRPTNLIGACLQRLGVDIGGSWWGFVGTADSTLASDGQRIYGFLAQGQVFALDLDGKTVWLQREKRSSAAGNMNPFHNPPLLCGDLLLVRSAIANKGGQTLRAFDAATGKLRWETPLMGSSHAVPCLMRLPGADGKPVDVLVSNMAEGKDKGQAVLRVADGKILGYLPPKLIARGPLMAVFGQQVTWVEDTGPACSYRLRLDDAGAAVAEEVFVKEGFRQHNFPTVTGRAMLNGNRLFDATTGTVISNLPARVGELGVVAGHHLITLATEGGWHGDINNSPKNRERDDRMTFGVFTVLDIKDPAKPVVVAKNNLLGYREPAADIIVSTYFKDFDPNDFAGCYKGSASYFAMMGGPVPAGNKLLIQSSAFLYCIGHREGSGPQVGEK